MALRGGAITERLNLEKDYNTRTSWKNSRGYVEGRQAPQLKAGEGVLSKELREDFLTWLESRGIKKLSARKYCSLVDRVMLNVSQGAAEKVQDKAGAQAFLETWGAAIAEQLKGKNGHRTSRSAWRHFTHYVTGSEPSRKPVASVLSKEFRADFECWLESRGITEQSVQIYGSLVDRSMFSVSQGAGETVQDREGAQAFLESWDAAIAEERRSDGNLKSHTAWRHFTHFVTGSEPSRMPVSRRNASSSRRGAGTRAKRGETSIGSSSSSNGSDWGSDDDSSWSSSNSSSGQEWEIKSESSEDEE